MIKADDISIAARKRTQPNCRDEVLVALEGLIAEHGDRPLAASAIYALMLELGTSYAELTAYTAMQRMKLPDPRLPGIQLERDSRQGFRLIKHNSVAAPDPALGRSGP